MSEPKGKGKRFLWLVERADIADGDCLIWPFYRNPNGYGQFGHLGTQHWAHRMMCELANGTPPTPKHEASHSCGRGNQGCVHPKHLKWKTKVENRADCAIHGTEVRVRGGSNKGRLTVDQVDEIRSLKGIERQVDLAARFGISWQSVSMIQRGKMYSAHKKVIHWSPTEEQQLRDGIAAGKNFPAIARIIGKKAHAVSCKAYRLGLRSGQQPAAARVYQKRF